jgi:energy-coupling factor transport system ATP-binding protein
MPAVECAGLTFTYPGGVRALDGVDLLVEAGEAVAIVGQNGSGKTTLIRHLNGLISPSEGSVTVGGRAVAGTEPADLAPVIGLVFQNPGDQIFQSKVIDEVSFGVRQLGLAEDVIATRVATALGQVGLATAGEAHPYDLTLGDRKLLCLASILAMEPDTLVLDEPTTGLDSAGVDRLSGIVRALNAAGRTVITVTHDMELVAELFGRTIVMHNGRVILDGPTAEVFRQADVLARASVKPSAMSRLAQELGLPDDLLTVQQMVEWLTRAAPGRPSSGLPVAVLAGDES